MGTAALVPDRHAGWVRPLASAVLPGSGQLIAGKDRGALYLVTEVFLGARFLAKQREGQRQADEFRSLALLVARRKFAPAARDTSFGYFEEMASFIESGDFDTDPGPAFVPPRNEFSFNGHIWRLARETFFQKPDSFPNPDAEEYQRALEFYRNRAVGPNFLWSWRGAALEHDLFRQSIRASDRAFQAATQHLGAMLANHLLSAVDAFVSQRLAQNGRPVSFHGFLHVPGTGPEGTSLIFILAAPF